MRAGREGDGAMWKEILLLAAALAAWVVLSRWVLPKLGIPT